MIQRCRQLLNYAKYFFFMHQRSHHKQVNDFSMSPHAGRSRNAQRGQAIFPLVLILTAVFGLIGVTFAGVAYLQSLLSSQRAFAEVALQAAASGVDDALLRIARDSTYRTTALMPPTYDLDVDGVTATVAVNDAAAGSCGTDSNLTCIDIDATASRRNVTRSLEVIVEVSPSGATRVLSRRETVN